MKSALRRVSVITLSLSVCAAAVAADDAIPVEYFRPLKTAISVGVRQRTEGPKVKFGNLGDIPINVSIGAATGSGSRQYNDGYVILDGFRTNEPNPATGTTYDIKETINGTPDVVTGTYRAYLAGQTREWGYSYEPQLVGNTVQMHAYYVTTAGSSIEATGDADGGFELKVERTLGKIGKRLEWGAVVSFGMNDINIKTTGGARAKLHTITDTYQLVDPASSNFPSGTNPIIIPPVYEFDANGNVIGVTTPGSETTNPLKDSPNDPRTDVASDVTIDGTWQIKGAYFMVHLGPSLRYSLGEHFAVSGSVGGAGVFVGTKYRASEYITLPRTNGQLAIEEENETKDLVFGYYGEFNLEYWLTPRTGFFVGAFYEKMGDYKQDPLAGRTAEIDIGGGTGFRLGLTTKF